MCPPSSPCIPACHRRLLPIAFAALALPGLALVAVPDSAQAEGKRFIRHLSKRRDKRIRHVGIRRIASRHQRRSAHTSPAFRGHRVSDRSLRVAPATRPSGDLWIYSKHLKEETRVNLYDTQGHIDDTALAALDHGFRCRRTRTERAVDPRLYEALSSIQDHFQGRRIDLVSGLRIQKNEASRHFHASAADFRIQGVSIMDIRSFAESLDAGGMGIGVYPNSGFVHMDFRAPGEPSYRWVDFSNPHGKKRADKSRSRRRHRPRNRYRYRHRRRTVRSF